MKKRYNTIATRGYTPADIRSKNRGRTRIFWIDWKFFASKKVETGNEKEFILKRYILIIGVNETSKSTLYQILDSLQNMPRDYEILDIS